jgi:hypothetical protein
MNSKERKKHKKMLRKEEIKRLREAGYNKHHIFCKSRGGGDEPENIVYINVKKHQKYHELFSNKTPPEVVEYLVRVFFKNNWGYVYEAIAMEEQNG